MSRGIFILAILFFALPYLLLTAKLSTLGFPEWDEFEWAFQNSLAQGFFSTMLALLASVPLMQGLWLLPPRWKALASWFLLLPSLLPPLFVLLSFLSWVSPFPVGLIGVVVVQGFLNAGLVAVLLSRAFEDKLQGLAEAAWVMGASRIQFMKRSFRLMAPEVVSVGIAVFSFCFANFSIPIVIGGGRATTIEILIYEKLRISGDWGQALGLSLFQLSFMALLLFLPRSGHQPVEVTRAQGLRFLGNWWGVAACLIYASIFWFPLAGNFPASVRAVFSIEGLPGQVAELALPSFILAFGVGGLFLMLALIFSMGFPDNQVTRLSRGWLAPSTVLLGFAFVTWGDWWPMLTYTLAMGILFFLPVFRLGLDRKLEGLVGQIATARTMGASDFLIWKRILVPQIWSIACMLAGVASLWAFGEFALGKVLLSQNTSWALLSEALMSSYRIEAGLGVGFLILFCGGLLFAFFWRLGNVGR